MQRLVIPCEPSRQYLLCNWQAASLSSAYRAQKTARKMDGWIDTERGRPIVASVCALRFIFAKAKYVFGKMYHLDSVFQLIKYKLNHI